MAGQSMSSENITEFTSFIHKHFVFNALDSEVN